MKRAPAWEPFLCYCRGGSVLLSLWLFRIELLYQLAHFGNVEEVVDVQLVVGLDARVDVLALHVVQSAAVGGIAIAKAVGRGL